MSTVTFIEPGGDADFGVALWPEIVNAPTAANDFVHGAHLRSTKYRKANDDEVISPAGSAVDAGGRISVWVYLNAYPDSTSALFSLVQSNASTNVIMVRVTTSGVLRLTNNAGTQLGSNGATISLSTWYRLSLAWTITSTSVNHAILFLNGTSTISVTNVTLSAVTTNKIRFGNLSSNGALDLRTSDHYLDNSSALTDPGTVWVTAKRPVANGTTNGFTTQIGTGGSGYGTGHSPQVNERPLSATNGWSMVGAGSAVTEEYTIEAASVGDINIGSATLLDFMGWVDAKSLANETASLILAGSTSNISLTSTTAVFSKMAGSSTYPSGGTDIGIITTTAVTTVSLYECGVVFAYIPSTGTAYFITQPAGLSIFASNSAKVSNKTLVAATAVEGAILTRQFSKTRGAALQLLQGNQIKATFHSISSTALSLRGSAVKNIGKAANALLLPAGASLGKTIARGVAAGLGALQGALTRAITRSVSNATMLFQAGVTTKLKASVILGVLNSWSAMSSRSTHKSINAVDLSFATTSSRSTTRTNLNAAIGNFNAVLNRNISHSVGAVTSQFSAVFTAASGGIVHLLNVVAVMVSFPATTNKMVGKNIGAINRTAQGNATRSTMRSSSAMLLQLGGGSSRLIQQTITATAKVCSATTQRAISVLSSAMSATFTGVFTATHGALYILSFAASLATFTATATMAKGASGIALLARIVDRIFNSAQPQDTLTGRGTATDNLFSSAQAQDLPNSGGVVTNRPAGTGKIYDI